MRQKPQSSYTAKVESRRRPFCGSSRFNLYINISSAMLLNLYLFIPSILGSDENHVWRTSLDQPSLRVDEMVQTLSDYERQRADLFRLERERQRFIVGRAVLRRILSFYLELDPDQVQFCYGPRGKPFLASNQEIKTRFQPRPFRSACPFCFQKRPGYRN